MSMSQQGTETVRIRRPTFEFVLCLIGGGVSLGFSSNLTGYSESFFIGNLLIENFFILALGIVLVAGMLYERPESHVVYGLILIVFSLNQFVILVTLFSTLPFVALGPIGPFLTLAGGLLALRSRSRFGR